MTLDPQDFSLVFSRALGKVIVHIHGPLDADAARQLRARLVDIIDGQGNRDVVVDLRRMTFIDAAGFSALLHMLQRMQKRGGKLVFSGPTSSVARGFEAAGLDKVFDITPAWEHPASGDGRTNRLRSAGWEQSG